MSQETGNSLHEMGNIVPASQGLASRYPQAIAAALRAELGSTRRVIKTAMRWTGASERTVKLWLAGRTGPNGQHLVGLARYSDQVFESILALSQRNSASDHSYEMRKKLREIIDLAQEMLESR
jgi:hypothetical protein